MSSLDEMCFFLQEIEDTLQIIHQETNQNLDGALLLSQWVTQAVLEIEHLLPSPDGETLSNSLLDVVNNLQQNVDQRNRPSIKGRPTIAIPEDQLVMLLQNHYNITDIASLLQVSPRTIQRRIIQYGLHPIQALMILKLMKLPNSLSMSTQIVGRRVLKAIFALMDSNYNDPVL